MTVIMMVRSENFQMPFLQAVKFDMIWIYIIMQNIFFPTGVISVWNGFPLQFTDFMALINGLTAQDNWLTTNYFSLKWIYGQNGWLLGSVQVTVSTVALTELTSSVCSAWWCWHTCRRYSRHRVDFHQRSTRKGWGWFAETGGTPVCSHHPHCQTRSPAGMLCVWVWVRNLGVVIFFCCNNHNSSQMTEIVNHRTANIDDGARLDIKAQGFWAMIDSGIVWCQGI